MRVIKMIEKSYAKVNMAINVINRLPDNYHNLDMINVSISLHDTIKVKFHHDENIKIITSNDVDLPTDETNIISKVIEKVKTVCKVKFGYEVNITKRISKESGLGGGSANAATMLKILNKKFHLKMTPIQMVNFIQTISSDAPYQLYNLPSRVSKKGSDVSPFESKIKGKLFIVKPKSGCNTKEVYANLNLDDLVHPNINKVERAMKEGDVALLSRHVGNSLLDAATKLNPDIEPILNELKGLGFEVVSMTGSGSACYGYSKNKQVYRLAKARFAKDNYDIFGAYKIINVE